MNLEYRFRGRRSAQSLQQDGRMRGRGWAAAAFCVAGTALGEPGVQILWQAQYTEPSGGPGGAAGPRVAFMWQAQYLVNLEVQISWQAAQTFWQGQCTEPPGPAAARDHHSSHTTHHTTHLTPLITHHLLCYMVDLIGGKGRLVGFALGLAKSL